MQATLNAEVRPLPSSINLPRPTSQCPLLIVATVTVEGDDVTVRGELITVEALSTAVVDGADFAVISEGELIVGGPGTGANVVRVDRGPGVGNGPAGVQTAGRIQAVDGRLAGVPVDDVGVDESKLASGTNKGENNKKNIFGHFYLNLFFVVNDEELNTMKVVK